MELETFTRCFAKLAGAIDDWCDFIPGDQTASDDGPRYAVVDYFHDVVEHERVRILTFLAVHRRDFLAQMFSDAIQGIYTAGVELASVCENVPPPGPHQHWEDVDKLRLPKPEAHLENKYASIEVAARTLFRAQVDLESLFELSSRQLVGAPPRAAAASEQSEEAAEPVAYKARYKPDPCPKCGERSRVAKAEKEIRRLVCTSCDHRWKIPK